jgi:hypothetical protein
MDEFDKILDEMIPKSLDDIIKINRDICVLRLADEQQLSAIAGEIWTDRIKDEISNYRLVSLILKDPEAIDPETVSVHLLGMCSAGHSWITSRVIVLDLERGYAATRSGSIYKLVGPLAHDEPDRCELIFLCAALNTWGIGERMGVPGFYY